MPANVALDSSFERLIDLQSEPERIATGFVFTEGPVWDRRDSSLTFSDIQGNTLYRWTEAGGAEVFRRPSGEANGNTLDRQGRLITCEHANRRVSRTLPDGTVETIASHYQGKLLNSPNDAVCAANGDVYFTDPPYGLRRPDGSFAPQELPYSGVYRISAADGALTLLAEDFVRPNGLVISSDQRTIFIDDTQAHVVRAFDLTPNGLRNGRLFADVSRGDIIGLPDGMKMDLEGNLYVTANTAEGVWVFAPGGRHVGFIGVPEPPANLAWGGDDWKTLFITARSSVYRLRMKVAGQPVGPN